MKSVLHIHNFHLPPEPSSSDLSTNYEVDTTVKSGTLLKWYLGLWYFDSTSNRPHSQPPGNVQSAPQSSRSRIYPPRTLSYHPAQFEVNFTDPNPLIWEKDGRHPNSRWPNIRQHPRVHSFHGNQFRTSERGIKSPESQLSNETIPDETGSARAI